MQNKHFFCCLLSLNDSLFSDDRDVESSPSFACFASSSGERDISEVKDEWCSSLYDDIAFAGHTSWMNNRTNLRISCLLELRMQTSFLRSFRLKAKSRSIDAKHKKSGKIKQSAPIRRQIGRVVNWKTYRPNWRLKTWKKPNVYVSRKALEKASESW